MDHAEGQVAPEGAPNRWGKPRTTPMRAPLVIRTVADVFALSASPAQLKRLPPNGLVIAIPELDERARDAFRDQTRRYARACGCSVAGATFLLSSAASVGFAAPLALNDAWIDFDLTIILSMILVPSLTVAAKFLALRFARERFRRSCARLIQSLSGGSVVRDSRRTSDGV